MPHSQQLQLQAQQRPSAQFSGYPDKRKGLMYLPCCTALAACNLLPGALQATLWCGTCVGHTCSDLRDCVSSDGCVFCCVFECMQATTARVALGRLRDLLTAKELPPIHSSADAAELADGEWTSCTHTTSTNLLRATSRSCSCLVAGWLTRLDFRPNPTLKTARVFICVWPAIRS